MTDSKAAVLTLGRMPGNPAKQITTRQKVALVCGALGFCGLLLILGEGICRLCFDVQIQGNSRELFAGDVFGDSMGLSKNASGISFGAKVLTDHNGFRVSADVAENPAKPAWLILGDSVGFGCGVEESETFAGLLRTARPDLTVYNSSVIGYALPDYENVVKHFVPRHPEICKVILSFCLNDVSHTSAQQIDEFLDGVPHNDVVGTLKATPVIHEFHDFMRCRSKLYIDLKNLLTDTSQRYFRNDLDEYKVSDQTFESMMQPALNIDRELKAQGIELLVIIGPCEPQLRSNDPALDVPQNRLTEFLQAHEIRCINPLGAFRDFPGDRTKLYLAGDAMHFSPAGHRLYYEILADVVELPKAGRGQRAE